MSITYCTCIFLQGTSRPRLCIIETGDFIAVHSGSWRTRRRPSTLRASASRSGLTLIVMGTGLRFTREPRTVTMPISTLVVGEDGSRPGVDA